MPERGGRAAAGGALTSLLRVAALLGAGAFWPPLHRVAAQADSNVVVEHHGRISFAIGGSTERTWLLDSGLYLQDDAKRPVSAQALYRPDDAAGRDDWLVLRIAWNGGAARFELEALEIRSRFGDSGMYDPNDLAAPARCALQIAEHAGGALRGSGTCSPGRPDEWPVRFTFTAAP